MKKFHMSFGKGLLAVALLGVMSAGCYGPFKLTKKVHCWNGSFSNKWCQEGVFLLTGVLLPVYGLAMLGDGLICNSIQFWGGENPVGDCGDCCKK